MPKKSERIIDLDIVRAAAIITMVTAHTIAFIYSGTNSFIIFLQKFGDTVSFSTFLIVSAASIWISYINTEENTWSFKRKNLIKRIIFLTFGYYLIAFISTLHLYRQPVDFSWLKNFLEVILFINIPGYTEFIPAFILFSLICVIFKSQIKRLVSNTSILIIISVILYFSGIFITQLNLAPPFSTYLSLFASNIGIYRFPILYYFPLFSLGLYIGKEIYTKQNKRSKIFRLNKLLTLSCLVLFSVMITGFIINSKLNIQRWPPDPGFLILGVVWTLSIAAVTAFFGKLLTILGRFGRLAFPIYIVHLSILQLEKITVDYRENSAIYAIITIVLLIFTSFVIAEILIKLKQKNAA